MNRFENGYALLIAVNENQMPGYALPTVAKDAAALEAVLVHPERCAYPKDNVRLLQGAQSSRDGIQAGLAWLKQKLAADTSDNATALIYYSGHGARNATTETYYLLPYDMGTPVTQTAIAATDFAAQIDAVRPRRLLVILDCCHAGGMSIKGDDPVAAEGLRTAALTPQSSDVSVLGAGRGRAILSSSTNEEQSYIRQDMAMSIFTYHLVEALTGHAAPPDGATTILVSDVMSYVTRAVPASAQQAYSLPQTPSFYVSGENFPVALLLGGRGLSKGEAAPSPLSVNYWPPKAPAEASGGLTIGGGVDTGGGAFSGRDTTVHGSQFGSSHFVLSGDFRGAVLNIQSTMQNVTQSINSAPAGEPSDRAELMQLVAALRADLEQVPPDRQKEVDAVANRLQSLTNELDRGDREMLTIIGGSLERSAEALSDVRPSIRTTAAQIAEAVRRFARI